MKLFAVIDFLQMFTEIWLHRNEMLLKDLPECQRVLGPVQGPTSAIVANGSTELALGDIAH